MKIGCAVLWHTAARLNQSTHDAWSGKFSHGPNATLFLGSIQPKVAHSLTTIWLKLLAAR
jgi:predicted membrane channel-forming protein YqfA (hemolysin III family)